MTASSDNQTADCRPARCASLSTARPAEIGTLRKLAPVLRWTDTDFHHGRFRFLLYRFLAAHIPAVSACVWTWVRLTAPPGRFDIVNGPPATAEAARERLQRLSERIADNAFGHPIGLTTLLPDLLTGLFRDGLFAGFLTVRPDGAGVDRFVPIDPVRLTVREHRGRHVFTLETDHGDVGLDRPDFYVLTLGDSLTEPLGRSLLQSIPTVSYIEQQLVDDMRRSSHNSGFHRLHVRITPPERMAGESDTAYTARINEYFDATVRMIRSCEVDDNPVTWDNVRIDYIGPGKSREVTNSWFMNHRAMIEEICAGTNLSPYLLGYSYGATTTWAGFKFDIVMRQVRSIQAQVAAFLEWIAAVDLALAGFDHTPRWVFDNTFPWRAGEEAEVATARVDNLLKLHQAGLIDRTEARRRALGLLDR